MKKTLLLATLVVAGTLSALGQGVVNFQNRDTANGVDAPIWGTATASNAGGFRLDGADARNFHAALYGAPGAGAAASSMVMLADPATGATVVGFRTGAAAGYVLVGTATGRAVPGAAYGSQVTVQIRAWSGSALTYETAVAGQVFKGVSAPVTMGTTTSALDVANPPMVGLQSFAVTIPEPSSIALGLLGLGALTLFRRRK